MRILLLGANGQVGQALCQALPQAFGGQAQIVAYRRGDLDLANFDGNPQSLCRDLTPQIIINAAAYTDVDKAENETTTAMQINATALKHLSHAANALKARLVHYSSDYVFNGKASKPYRETDSLAPISVYGKSKAQGDLNISTHCQDYLILRCAWVYSPHGRNFVKTIMRLAQQKQELKIVNDQWGTPTSAKRIAEISTTLLHHHYETARGLYHLSPEGSTNWHEYASFIIKCAQTHGLAQQCQKCSPISSDKYNFTAPRPAYSVLNSNKLQRLLGFPLPHWQDDVAEVVNILANATIAESVSNY